MYYVSKSLSDPDEDKKDEIPDHEIPPSFD
jgi:hypothetical protein